MMLAASEIASLTGYVRASAQVRWLRRHGWRFTVDRLGRPVIAAAEFNRHMVGGSAARREPDWGALNNGPHAHTR
jgi:hypothetical protein